jgi:hypothetical protein
MASEAATAGSDTGAERLAGSTASATDLPPYV